MVRSLLDNGVSISVADDEGLTLLYFAARGGHKDVARLLITKGADGFAQDNRGWTPIKYARDYGNGTLGLMIELNDFTDGI
jgi:ankyrin repeat protein